jgi:hypothetical protein
MQVPLDRLRFHPDPLRFNQQYRECNCFRCQVRRRIAAQLGIPPEAILKMQLLPMGAVSVSIAEAFQQKAAASGDEAEPRELRGPTPEEVAEHTPAPLPGPPLITTFDTRRDGTPHIPPVAPLVDGLTPEDFDLPPVMIWTAKVFAYVIAWSYIGAARLKAFILGRPVLRVVREDQ